MTSQILNAISERKRSSRDVTNIHVKTTIETEQDIKTGFLTDEDFRQFYKTLKNKKAANLDETHSEV